MAKTRKIGVLTFHRCINYGSYWQARCLVEGLRRQGHDAVLLDHHSRSVNRAEWKCAFRPTLPARPPREDYRLYAAKTRRFFEAFAALPLSARFDLEDPGAMPSVDLAVVGSDEVWNLRHPWYAGYPLFFGDGLKADRVVSYAASFGNHDASDPIGEPWARRLERFAAIGVRDENSRELVRRAVRRDPEVVLDPCLQFSAICRRSAAADAQGDVLVYGHSFPDWFVVSVRKWARARRLRLVSLGYRNDWADEQRLAAGPEEFAQAMADAGAVVTNFFHGCVFALVHEKPFVAVPSAYRSNKISALVATVGAGDRLVRQDSRFADFEGALAQPLDPAIPARIDALRRRSAAYLDHAVH